MSCQSVEQKAYVRLEGI